MALPVHISNPATGEEVKVTASGQLVVGPVAYDTAKFIEMDVIDTAYNFVAPQTGMQFVITGLRLKADRGVSNTTDAQVVFFEATSATSTAVAGALAERRMGENMLHRFRLNLVLASS